MLCRLRISLFLLATCSVVPVLADEATSQHWWPQFRGPGSRGIAEPGPYPTELNDASQKWQLEIPAGVSSPCVWGNHLFVTGFDRKNKKFETICVARDTGAVLWQKGISTDEVERVHRDNSPASATPTTDGERVYLYFGSYGLVCYDFAGEQLWTKPLGIARNRWGMGTSPILAKGLLILACDQGGRMGGVNPGAASAKSFLLACDPLTGETTWRLERPEVSSGWSTPLIWKQDGVEQLVHYSNTRVVAYSIEDGQELWRVNRLPYDAVGTPVVGEEMLFVSGTVMGGDPDAPIAQPFEQLLSRGDENKDGKLSMAEAKKLALDPRQPSNSAFMNYGLVVRSVDANKDGHLTKGEWGAAMAMFNARSSRQPKDQLVAIRSGAAGNATNTHVAWRFGRGIPDNPSPLYFEGRLHLLKSGGLLTCIDAKNGKRIYRKRIGLKGEISSSPIAADGYVYAASEAGTVVVVRPESGEVVAKRDLGEKIMATPAFVEGTIYVRTDRHLYAFGDGRS